MKSELDRFHPLQEPSQPTFQYTLNQIKNRLSRTQERHHGEPSLLLTFYMSECFRAGQQLLSEQTSVQLEVLHQFFTSSSPILH